MKNKYIYIFCGIALILILGVSVSKTVFTNANTESTAASIQSDTQCISDNSTTSVTNFITELTTAPKTNHSEPGDLSCFDNSVFLGNSRFISFKNYGLAKNVYSVVGLNVDTVFTKSVSGSNVTVINELNGKNYEKVILMFGDNECGWPNQNVFIERYSKVIAAVRERIPDAQIYLHSILPVSAQASSKSEFGCNNETINALNIKIKQLAADEGVEFIEQPACLKDADGALLPEAASDGIHLNKKYSEIWLNYLAETII